MALGSNEPLTDMSTTNLPGGRGRQTRKADNLTTIFEPTVENVEASTSTSLWAFTACHLYLLLSV
jgi:hypothetical protein